MSRCSAWPRRRRRAASIPKASIPKVTLFHAADCHLCARARAQLEVLRAELDFELEEVDIGGVPELEERYREWLPVVEIDGERAFTYFVHEDAFRRKVAQARGRTGTL